MNRTIHGILAFALTLSLAAAQDDRRSKSTTPAEQYKAMLKAYQVASGGGAANDEERMKLIGRVYTLRYKLALDFLELAEKNPSDPIAVDALIQAVWQVNNTPWPAELVGKDTAASRALEILRRDHIGSDKLGLACERISAGFNKEYDTFLRTVLATSPNKDVQGQACLALAHYLTNRLQRIEMVKEQPELAKEFADLFGKEYLEELHRQDRTRAGKEAEDFFEIAANKYPDVKTPGGGTVGEKAKAELFEIRHLSVGKEAPDIEGQDQDGIQFSLRDYRGKVVLLDFWHQQ